MQLVINDLPKFVQLYIKACRGQGSPDLYMVMTTERLPFGGEDVGRPDFIPGVDASSGNPCISNGQLVSNWSFLDDLNATAVLYRHLEAVSRNVEDFRTGDSHDTYVQIVAKIRTAFIDRNPSIELNRIEELLPDAFYGCVAEGLDHHIVLSIIDENYEESRSLYAHTGGSDYE